MKNALKFGRLSRSSSIDDDQRSLMGNHRSSGIDDSTDGFQSSDVEAGHADYEDMEDEYSGDQDGEARPEKKRPPR